jgi:hypothetical protein
MSWINGGSKKIEEQDPTEIEQATVGDVIECTGWWEAGNWITAEWTASKGVGDDLYYITKWTDSSGQGNHLLDESLGLGPRAYGSRTNEWGDSNDELNKYSVAHFQDVDDGSAQGQLYLKCTPSVSADFQSSTSSHLNCVIVARHHYDGSTHSLESFSSEMQNSTSHFISSYNTSTNYWLMGIGNTSISEHDPVFNTTRHGVLGTHSEILDGTNSMDNEYHVAGFFGTTTASGVGWGVTGFNSNGYPLVQQTPNNLDIEDAGDSSGKIYVGSGDPSFNSSKKLEGRIVEMACWKSDNPISKYNRASIIQYFRNKFNL